MHCTSPNLDVKKLDLRLRDLNELLAGDGPIKNVALTVLDDERFPVWSAASKSFQHHYGKHGLILHTSEVIELCLTINDTMENNVDRLELYYSGLFHDAGKMFDYIPTNPEKTEWTGSLHKKRIHHISRSALIWSEAVRKCGTPWVIERYHDRVLHNILSHHGCREWGSPVSPDTKSAWMLHLCDNMSARCYETE